MADKVPVSVVISVLNEGLRLRETISSVVAARVQPAEIVVVDDGSADGCTDAIEVCGTVIPRVRVFETSSESSARFSRSAARL